MNLRLTWTLILLFLLSSMKIQAQEMKMHIDKATQTSIEYLSNWEYQANPLTILILIRPVEEIGQIFRENVNLVISDAPARRSVSLRR
jgi:hypothetical protein